MGRTIKTTIAEAVDYWSRHQSECGLSVDWAEAHERCWRCGCERDIERCHIVPDALGGPDAPENIVANAAIQKGRTSRTRRSCGTGSRLMQSHL